MDMEDQEIETTQREEEEERSVEDLLEELKAVKAREAKIAQRLSEARARGSELFKELTSRNKVCNFFERLLLDQASHPSKVLDLDNFFRREFKSVQESPELSKHCEYIHRIAEGIREDNRRRNEFNRAWQRSKAEDRQGNKSKSSDSNPPKGFEVIIEEPS